MRLLCCCLKGFGWGLLWTNPGHPAVYPTAHPPTPRLPTRTPSRTPSFAGHSRATHLCSKSPPPPRPRQRIVRVASEPEDWGRQDIG